MNTMQFKENVKSAAEYLERSGITVPHTKLLEAISRAFGERNWSTMRALLENPPVASEAHESVDNELVEDIVDNIHHRAKKHEFTVHSEEQAEELARETSALLGCAPNSSEISKIVETLLQPEKDSEPDEADDAYSSKYFISEGWGHLFGPGSSETTVRFVFDRKRHKIIFMQYESRGWCKAAVDDIADVEDSLKNANDDALTNPEAWDLVESDELPDWAIQKG